MSSTEVSGGSLPTRTRLLKLRCAVKNYDWGRIGVESGVARLYSRNSGDGVVDDGKPYAEFWMGTHDSGPSFVVSESEEKTLKSLIEANPSLLLGDKVVERWGVKLPFLFKVLSVAKALSIQAHPDKELAEFLHKVRPDAFKDDNHKPEMALALTEFEALCGFVSLKELKDVFQNVPEITEVVDSAYADEVLDIHDQDDEEYVKTSLQSIFTQLMSASNDVIGKAVSRLKIRLNIERELRQLTDKEQLVLRLEKQYPEDVGVLASLLFNHVKLKAGEALYLGANEPHAYLRGECIECMATSDNVVRAGLTPKERDVQILCSMLTYKQGLPEILEGEAINPYTRRYRPPFDEFEVDRCILPAGAEVDFPAVGGPSIFVVLEGEEEEEEEGGRMVVVETRTSSSSCSKVEEEEEEVTKLKEGDVVFAPADTHINVRATKSDLHIYRAGVNASRLFF